MKKALITGITGQDGSYLAELLLEKGYEVHGIKRRTSSHHNTWRIDHLYVDRHLNPKLYLHYGDMTDSTSLIRLIREIEPDEIYNLAAMSHVKVSFEAPEYTAEVDAVGTMRILEAIRICGLEKKTKFYQASTSELYGKVGEVPQTEETPFHPRSPYAVAKIYSYWAVINYREAYNLFAVNGILFNHESPRRGETFVTRKITIAIAQYLKDQKSVLFLGNLDSKRDWGYAKEYVYGMWLMLQQENPEDILLATGETHSVREFIEIAFSFAGVEVEWKGERGTVHEYAIDKKNGQTIIKIDPEYFRPTEVDLLIGNPAKAKKILGWEPKTKFKDLVELMVKEDLKRVSIQR